MIRHDLVVRTGGVEDGLGGPGLIVPERDRGRAGEQAGRALPDRVIGGDAHQAVLDDAVGDVLLAQGAPDLGDLLHGEAAVLGHDHRPGIGEFLAQLGDGLPFGLGRHGASVPSARDRRAAVGRPDVRSGLPLRRSHGGLPGEADPGSQGRTHRWRWRHRLPRRARRRPRLRSPRGRFGGPVRRIKLRPSSDPKARRGPRAQAVCGGPSCLVR